MDTPQAPAAPDPTATANAQAVMNQDTATTQQLLNQTNQVTPGGTLNYNQTGSNSFTDASGKTVNVPQFTATTSLSPGQQAIYDINQGTQKNIAQIGSDQSAKIGSLLGTPLNVDQAISDKITKLGATRLDPQFAQSEEALRTRMANSGIQVGSAAYDASMRDFNQGKNDAYNSLYLSGDQQAEQEAIAERNQPINEITALMSGSQVSSPTFSSTPQTSVGGVDYLGAQQLSSGVAQNNFNQQTASNNAMMGGMFGLAGAGITGGASLLKPAPVTNIFSDRRLKKNIHHVGKLHNGLPVYSFRYKGSSTPQIGLMADEVERVHPNAVTVGPGGYKMVDYDQAVEA